VTCSNLPYAVYSVEVHVVIIIRTFVAGFQWYSGALLFIVKIPRNFRPTVSCTHNVWLDLWKGALYHKKLKWRYKDLKCLDWKKRTICVNSVVIAVCGFCWDRRPLLLREITSFKTTYKCPSMPLKDKFLVVLFNL